MSLKHFGVMETQMDIIYGYNGCNSGPNPFFCLFSISWTPVVFKNNFLKVILSLPLNNMSVEYVGDRGTQIEILSGHYGCNSGPNPFLAFFFIFWTP